MIVNFSYISNGNKKTVNYRNDYSNNDFKSSFIIEENKNYKRIKISIIPIKEIIIDKLYITTNYNYNNNKKIFVNGYQSWTDSREFFIDEKMRGITRLAKPVMKKYQFDKYGDYTFKKYPKKSGIFHGYTYSYVREDSEYNLIGSLTERNGFTIIEHLVKNNEIIIHKDCSGLHINSEYTPFDLIFINGKENVVFDTYFELMNIKKPSCKPMTGWTSWYNYYQNINQDIILDNLNNFASLKKDIDIFQIDDGYQTAVGDWLSVDLGKFPNGMKYIAKNIKSKGYKAGIWLSPFVCETNSKIYKEKYHWIQKDSKGEPVAGGGNWSKFYALDFYNPEVQGYIKNVFNIILNCWGYDMVKLDFLYAVCLFPRKDKTRGQIMTEAMEFIRECVGDRLILGCGVPLGPSFGLVDYCRIGCDVGLDWDDKPYMRLLHRERISTLNAIRNAIGRRHLDGRAFYNDPDVFLLRDDNITLTQEQKLTLSIVNNIFGSLIFTSDNISKYNEATHTIFNKIMNLNDKNIESVNETRDGLVEIIFKQNNDRHLVLINLINKPVKYMSQYQLTEIFINTTNEQLVNTGEITVTPYTTRMFTLH